MQMQYEESLKQYLYGKSKLKNLNGLLLAKSDSISDRWDEIVADKSVLEEIEAEIKEFEATIAKTEIETNIHLDNMKYYMWEMAVPVFKEVFAKYEGKRFGPATKKKIFSEIAESLNNDIRVGISGVYNDEDYLYIRNGENAEVKMYKKNKWDGKFFEDNIITQLNDEDLCYPDPNAKIHENIVALVEEAYNSHEKLKAEAKKFKEMVDEHNSKYIFGENCSLTVARLF